MTKRRGRLEIYAQMLRIAKDEIGPTRLMYASNMSWTSCNKFISDLIARDLIARKYAGKTKGGRDKATYKTTDRGLELLKTIQSSVLLADAIGGE